MTGGKRQLADNLLMDTCRRIKEIQLPKYYKAPNKQEEILTDPTQIISQAIENAKPLMALQNVQVGSVMYNVPVPISESRWELF